MQPKCPGRTTGALCIRCISSLTLLHTFAPHIASLTFSVRGAFHHLTSDFFVKHNLYTFHSQRDRANHLGASPISLMQSLPWLALLAVHSFFLLRCTSFFVVCLCTSLPSVSDMHLIHRRNEMMWRNKGMGSKKGVQLLHLPAPKGLKRCIWKS